MVVGVSVNCHKVTLRGGVDWILFKLGGARSKFQDQWLGERVGDGKGWTGHL